MAIEILISFFDLFCSSDQFSENCEKYFLNFCLSSDKAPKLAENCKYLCL